MCESWALLLWFICAWDCFLLWIHVVSPGGLHPVLHMLTCCTPLTGCPGYLQQFNSVWQNQVPETTVVFLSYSFSLILAWALSTDAPLSQKTIPYMQMRWLWQYNILSPPSPKADWQLCPGKLASYLTGGIMPSIGSQETQQQNDHKWISAVKIQELIPSHWVARNIKSLLLNAEASIAHSLMSLTKVSLLLAQINECFIQLCFQNER